MKMISWNVNGLRAVHKKDFLGWFHQEKADVICLQEIKVGADSIEGDEALGHPGGYHSHWHFAEKAGYSGLVIYAKKDPSAVRVGLGDMHFDSEGRWLEADFGKITVINTYFPNSQRDHARLPYKIAFCAAARQRLAKLRAAGREVYLCGDLNIAHREIDLKNPKTNIKNAGFLPEERQWLDLMLGTEGWLDTFRVKEPGPGHYTWWSYRPGVRERNIGWRLDYFLTQFENRDRIKAVEHLTKVLGSDHCPVRLTVKS